jgi:hypothetical protein
VTKAVVCVCGGRAAAIPTSGGGGAAGSGLDDLSTEHASHSDIDRLREVFCETTSTDLLSPGFLPEMVCAKAWCSIMGVSFNYLYHSSALHLKGRASEYYATMGGTTAADFRAKQPIIKAAELRCLGEVQALDYETGLQCSCDGGACFCRQLPLAALQAGRTDYVSHKGFKARNAQLMRVLWHCDQHRSSELHEDYVRAWLGVSVRKIRAMRALAQAAVDAGDYGLEKAVSHGSVAKEALTKFPPHVKASIATFLDVHTRTDPTKPRVICTSHEMHGISGMYEHLADFFPELPVVSRRTFFRYVRDILSERGLDTRIRATKSDHNVCHVCKVLNDRRSELSMSIKKCDLDLQQWSSGSGPPRLQCGIDFRERPHLVSYRSIMQSEWQQADDLFKKHEKLDKDMRAFLARAVLVAQEAEKHHPARSPEHVPWRSRDTMRVVHVDDRRCLAVLPCDGGTQTSSVGSRFDSL